MNLHKRIRTWLEALPETQRRTLRDVRPLGGGQIALDGRTVTDFASNDYLGLSSHPELADRANAWMQSFGAGSRASRLVSGNLAALSQLEEKLARLKGTESALIFGSGFQANSSILAALLDRKVRQGGSIQVLTDRLCHASFHFGLAVTGLKQQRYRHNDLQHLEELLQNSGSDEDVKLIATESLFSMEGDRLDVEKIRRIAAGNGAMLYVDEAHATGVTGSNGMGLMVQQGSGQEEPLTPGKDNQVAARPNENEIVLGTFGKALGSYGAYVACSQQVREYLVNRCAGLIYSTALPPMVLGAIDAALDLVPTMSAEREHLRQLSQHLTSKLQAAGFDTRQSDSHIVPIMIADDAGVLQVSRNLLEAGFLVAAIRPPTVPHGTTRLRVSLSAVHTGEQIDGLVQALQQFAPVEVSG